MSMSDFIGFALTRSEMKQVVGGQCHYLGGGTVYPCDGAAACKQVVKDGWAEKWCCDSCSTSTWCKGC